MFTALGKSGFTHTGDGDRVKQQREPVDVLERSSNGLRSASGERVFRAHSRNRSLSHVLAALQPRVSSPAGKCRRKKRISGLLCPALPVKKCWSARPPARPHSRPPARPPANQPASPPREEMCRRVGNGESAAKSVTGGGGGGGREEKP